MLSAMQINTTPNWEFANFAGLPYVDQSTVNAMFDQDCLSSRKAESNCWHNGPSLEAMIESQLSEPYQTNELSSTELQSNLDPSSAVPTSLATIEPVDIQPPISRPPADNMDAVVSSKIRPPVFSSPSSRISAISNNLPRGPKPAEVITKKRLKRSLEETIPGFQCFSRWVQAPPVPSAQKRARATTVMQRRKRQDVKEKGACLRCRMYKLSVSFHLIVGSFGIIPHS